MQNPKFGVTAFTATVLTIICVGKVLLYPYLPPSKSEKLVTVDQRKAPPAAAVELIWQTEPEKAVQTAVRLRKALLWVVIDPRDSSARDLETTALRDPEVVRLINRYFVPVKLNSDDYPEAERLMFPLSRLQSYLRPGATVLATTAPGHLIGMIRPRGAGDRMSVPGVLLQLLGLKRQLDAHLAKPEVVLELDRISQAENERLGALVPISFIDNADLTAKIVQTTVPAYGGINSNGYCEVRPSTLDLLLDLGQVDIARRNVTGYGTSVGYDVVGGGIFDGIELGNPHRTIASKSALTNIALAEVVARIYALKKDSNMALILEDILESLGREFVDGANIFEGRVSDVEVSGLSQSFSLTSSRIVAKLNRDEAAWVRKKLLPKQVPSDYIGRFRSLDVMRDPMLGQARRKLRPSSALTAQHTRENRAFVVGFVCARLLKIYQLTGTKLALDLFCQLEPTLDGCFSDGTVYRISNQPTSGKGWLGSYLAVTDALLQKYLVLGDQRSLSVAQPILRETLTRFGSVQSDWLTITEGGESLIPGLSGSLPDLADPSYESTTATAIRLFDQFEPVLPDRELAGVLHERAGRMASLVAAVTEGGQIAASGAIKAARAVMQARRLEVVGPMGGVPAEFPLEYVIASKEKPAAKPGIYILQTGARSGPFTVAQAKAKLAGQ